MSGERGKWRRKGRGKGRGIDGKGKDGESWKLNFKEKKMREEGKGAG